ncbi:MAG: nickel pincer cofactor biosynthesis protein LarC [Leptolyngbyaceae cyanobacterium]
MRNLAFIDCPTGISGDMCLGAVVSAGVPLIYLQEHLARLKLSETVDLQERHVRKNGIAATKVVVALPHETDAKAVHPPARHWQEIKHIITAAQLPERVSTWSLAIFRRLAIAEGSIHGTDPQQVHFHEVGATDAIVDIVGTCLGLDWLRIDELYCSPLPTGRGTVRAAHGRLPVPAPAVLKLMEMAQVPIYNAGLQGELVTPTGAAIATELAHQFGEPPAMTLRKVGLGAGNKDFPMPNILRLWIGSETDALSHKTTHAREHQVTTQSAHDHTHHHHEADAIAVQPEDVSTSAQNRNGSLSLYDLGTLNASVSSNGASGEADLEKRAGLELVTVLETQVDDLSPQAIGYLYDCLLKSGALDVFTQSVTMKKSRPGHLITVITYPEQSETCEQILLRETTTLGVRQTQQTRLRLRREIVPLDMPLGTIRMKLAFAPNSDEPLKAHPEYEDCVALARQHNLPWLAVHTQALCHWQIHYAAMADDGVRGIGNRERRERSAEREPGMLD